ncbi:YceI family protein [Lacinutrix undariae]
MKTNIFKIALVTVLALTVASFTSLKEKTIEVKESKIIWKGYKVTGEHQGLINLEHSTLEFKKEKLVGGTFVIDMSSITVTDLSGEMKTNLEGHLKSDDFFGVEKHKTASFEITKAKENKDVYTVTGNLTIKGITHPTTFNMTIKNNTATANLKVDRTKYDVKYGSTSFFDNLKDKAISNEFDLNITLKF